MAGTEESPSWRAWTAKDRVGIVLVVMAGYVVKRVLPDGWFSTLGLAAYVAFFVSVWWRRRGVKPDLPRQDWAPPEPRPESDS